jgi:hypothetical protein
VVPVAAVVPVAVVVTVTAVVPVAVVVTVTAVVPVTAVTSIFVRDTLLRSLDDRPEIELDLGKSRAAIPLDANVLTYCSAQ